MKNIGDYASPINVNEPWFGIKGLIVNKFVKDGANFYTLYFFDATWGSVILTFKESELLFHWKLKFDA